MHSQICVHVWRMCGFTSMIWHHLLHPLPPFQLLSPTDIQSLGNDLSLQPAAIECIQTDIFAHLYSCVMFVSGHWLHYKNTYLTRSISFTSFPCSSIRDRTAAKSPRSAASHTYACINSTATRCVVVSYSIRHDVFDELYFGNNDPINSKRPAAKSDKQTIESAANLKWVIE